MTSILGISAFYHDSAAAIIIDGKIIAAAQEERFSRKKHDPSYPFNAIKFVVKELPILGDQSLIAAKASLAVLLDQGNAMYEAFTAKLIEYDGIINQKSISTLVESIGGDLETIQSVMESSKIYDILDIYSNHYQMVIHPLTYYIILHHMTINLLCCYMCQGQ